MAENQQDNPPQGSQSAGAQHDTAHASPRAAAGTPTKASGETRKVTLANAIPFKGKLYGPGKDVEVPAEFGDDLVERASRPVELAFKESTRPGSSGSAVEQKQDHVNERGVAQMHDVDKDNPKQGENPRGHASADDVRKQREQHDKQVAAQAKK